MNTTNNDKKKIPANTSGTVFYGRDAKSLKALGVRYYGSCVVIGMHLPLPEGTAGNAKYDYKTGTAIYLTAKNANTFAKLVKKALDAKEAGEPFKSKGIPSGNNGMIDVCFGDKFGLDADKICIAIYTVDDNKKASATDVFEFKDELVIVNYNPDGVYDHETNSSDVEYFITVLKEFGKGMTNGLVHAHKVDFKWSLDKLFQNQIAMMTNLGISNNSATTRTDWSNSNSGTSGQRTNAQSTEELANELQDMYR